ncbi:glutathione S-transferase family protein [Marinobacter algicola]|uniref:glutathione S-transferase family protein n=1 Tax=Marinobacter algicola TaxID=236100 RepID=UPI003BAA4F75
MNTLRLIDKPECPFCWRIRIAAALQGRLVEHLNREDPEVQAEWERLSPSRTVPVLIDGGVVVTDSGPMLEYLAETGPALLPENVCARVQARSLVVYADNPLGRVIREVVFEKRGKAEADWNQERLQQATADFVAVLPVLEQCLEGREYLVGDAASLAECALLPRFALAIAYGLPIPVGFPRLQAWFDRLIARPELLSTAPPELRDRLRGVNA